MKSFAVGFSLAAAAAVATLSQLLLLLLLLLFNAITATMPAVRKSYYSYTQSNLYEGIVYTLPAIFIQLLCVRFLQLIFYQFLLLKILPPHNSHLLH